MSLFISIFIGGGIGALTRYILIEKINKLFGPGNTDNPLEASPMGYPSWWVVNTQLGYQYRESLNLSLGLYNLLDVHFKTFASGISAPGRSLMVSAKLSF